jgi:hypothetical protein
MMNIFDRDQWRERRKGKGSEFIPWTLTIVNKSKLRGK